MEQLFLKIFNMSITAAWLTIAIILLRLIFKKAPKYLRVIMWSLVGFRLICPFSIESVLSLIPSAETVPEEILYSQTPKIHSGISYFNSAVNPIISSSMSPSPADSVNPMQILTFIAAVIWIIGILAFLVYSAISYILIFKRVCEAVPHSGNIYICDRIDTPFILGIIKPKIYLPSDLNEIDKEYVIAHEKAHLKRHDHLWKPIGFILLTVYWFNPILWVAYILLCRDIELACDEKVIDDMGVEVKKPYSEALINCSIPRRLISACPLAFGETGIKGRIKSVLDYKKPAFWIIIAAIIAGIITGICFLTNPKEKLPTAINPNGGGSELNGLSVELVSAELSSPSPYIEIKWKNETANDIIYGDEFYIYKKVGKALENCRSYENYVWNAIAYYIIPGGSSTKKYSLNGMEMSTEGVYRFESDCFIENDSQIKYNVWLEFELKEGLETISSLTLETEELVYDDGSYSFVQTADIAPDYRIVNGMHLQEIQNDGIVIECGTLTEVELNRERFDSRFRSSDGWYDGYSLSAIKTDNKRMWELYCESSNDRSILYILLEQADGSYYLGYGYYDFDGSAKNNDDGSHIRWLYRLSKAQTVVGNLSEQIAVDGSVFFYSTETDENDFPRQYKSFAYISDSDLDKILSLLKKQKWTNDNLVDRLSFKYDGQIRYKGNWLYFGYNQKIVYYGEYFCSVPTSLIKLIKSYELKADEYIPINLVSRILTYKDSPDPTSPTIYLFESNNSFQFSYSGFSSYIARGNYQLTDKRLILTTSDGKNVYVFNTAENGFKFDESASSAIPKYKYSANTQKSLSPVPDGALFTPKEADSHTVSKIITDEYETVVSFANYSNNTKLYTASLNSDKLYTSHKRHLPIRKFESLDELNGFKATFKNVLTMDKGLDETPSFNLVTKKYDKEFFKENVLFLVYLSSNSTSRRYDVYEVFNDGKNFSVKIIRTDNNESEDSAMSGWFITVAAPKSTVSSCKEFDAYIMNE